ncbi:MAG TPA: cobalamin biosynthesis protein CobW [Polyangiales bacterium]|jgi:cobalamin biosynthesis protein CobW|nr:cobalamin biosynthesis protein CobW [Polyangiales bacterium]
MNKLPTTIVTGFLGSGKTTLLRHLLQNANGRRLAVIVNEFGEVGVDGELLKQCGVGCEESEGGAGALYELSNGCLCCTVQEEFVPVLETLMERRDKIDHILIETSGLALPKPLVQAFQWPQIRAACTVDAVIALVDGPAVLSGQFASDPAAVDQQRRDDPNLDHERPLQELFEDQLTAADLVIVSKADELPEGGLARVQQMIAPHLGPGVKVVVAKYGELPFDVVLGLQRATESTIDGRHTHHDEDHEHGKPHSHSLFDTLVLRLGSLDREALLRGLAAVVRDHEVYRAKGFAAVSDKPMRLVVQGVGRRFDSYFDRPWAPNEARTTELVVIGSHLDRDSVMRTLLAAVES